MFTFFLCYHVLYSAPFFKRRIELGKEPSGNKGPGAIISTHSERNGDAIIRRRQRRGAGGHTPHRLSHTLS